MGIIPKDKFDVDALINLKEFSDLELNPFLPELLEWVQDMNWPVAAPIASRLSSCGISIVEPIKSVLLSTDAIWKYWVLSEIVSKSPLAVREGLRDEIARLISCPNAEDRAEEVDVVAREIMEKFADDT